MKKLLLTTSVLVIALCWYTVYQYVRFVDNKLHVVVCDVGQGEAILITTPKRYHVLIDAGPDASILTCLAENLPYWERTIDLIILTHPHADHLNGIHYVIDRYSLRRYMSEKIGSTYAGYISLVGKLHDKHIIQSIAYQGDTITFPDGVILEIRGPQKAYIASNAASGMMDAGAENASVVTLLSYGTFRYLLGGDSPSEYLLHNLPEKLDVAVLELPHHGSKTSTTSELLTILTPEIGIASVGEKNRYGHPSAEVINLLKAHAIPLLRTDVHGTIETITDGKTWRVRY